MRAFVALLALLGLAACAGTPEPPAAGGAARASLPGAVPPQEPPFVRRQYEPFSRESVVGIALREWRLFGQGVDDDPPDTRPPLPAELKPERMAGLWQRVGEYWWLALEPSQKEAAWTGKHDSNGTEFAASQDGRYAWSAAFVSYVMRIAGAGSRFPYSRSHSEYINIAADPGQKQFAAWVVTAERPEAYPPQPGDLICAGRGRAGELRFDDLPTGDFPSHCDIVVAVTPGQLTVIGGNVDDAVTMKHVPTTPDGKLASLDGTIIDGRYPWMVVLRVHYDGPIS